MATVIEIVERIRNGERVFLRSEDTFEFMRECVRHKVSISNGIRFVYAHGKCAISLTAERKLRNQMVAAPPDTLNLIEKESGDRPT